MKSILAQSPAAAAAMSAAQLREAFLLTDVFPAGGFSLAWWETDRTVAGGFSPVNGGLEIAAPEGLRTPHFFARREGGLINLGGPGRVGLDGTEHRLGHLDALYIGRGVKSVVLISDSDAAPARFWLLSYPAHREYPSRLIPFKDVKGDRLGARETANERTIYKLIHPGAFPTCQLVMGFTRLEPGCVWNTMPPHTHLRRSEVYLYFGLPPGAAVFHFMGQPHETRHLLVRDGEAVLSPPWSIHCGAGTAGYSFVWGMGGENQEFGDMDPVPLAELR